MTFLNYLCDDDNNHHHQSNGNSNRNGNSSNTATADAVVDTKGAVPVVAYCWDFDPLKNYLQGEREVRNALSAYMNHDLREKLARLTVHHHDATRTSSEISYQENGREK